MQTDTAEIIRRINELTLLGKYVKMSHITKQGERNGKYKRRKSNQLRCIS